MMQRCTLKNGMNVLIEKRPTASVALEVQIKVGSINENPQQAGMTHLIEHLLFEGTTTRTAHDISNAIESVGGEFNAATTHERTFYYIHIPKQYFARAVEIMADVIKNPLFDEKVIKKEKNVVLNEIKVVDDDPKSYQWVLFLKTLFQHNKAGNPVYGNPEVIKQMTRESILSYYHKHYIPQQMTISLVGNVNNPLPLLKKQFAALSPQSKPHDDLGKEPLLTQPRVRTETRDVEHVYNVIGYPGAPKGHKDSYVLDVIRSILGRGQSSRLFDEIRTKRGIAYIVGSLYESSLSFGAFASYVSTTPENHAEARKVLLEAFALKNLTQQEVNDAKSYIAGNFLIRNEDNKEHADANAEWSLLKKRPEGYIRNIKKVTMNDVRRVASTYFHKNYTEVLIQK